MTINVKCRCGKKYVLDDTKAGKTLRCKECGAAIVVPGGDDEFESDEYEVDVLPTQPRIVRSRASSGAGRSSPQSQRPTKSGSSTVMYWILGAAGGVMLLILLSCGGCFLWVGHNVQKAAEQARQDFEDPESDFRKALEEAEKEAEQQEREAAARKAGLPVLPTEGDSLKPDAVKPQVP